MKSDILKFKMSKTKDVHEPFAPSCKTVRDVMILIAYRQDGVGIWDIAEFYNLSIKEVCEILKIKYRPARKRGGVANIVHKHVKAK